MKKLFPGRVRAVTLPAALRPPTPPPTAISASVPTARSLLGLLPAGSPSPGRANDTRPLVEAAVRAIAEREACALEPPVITGSLRDSVLARRRLCALEVFSQSSGPALDAWQRDLRALMARIGAAIVIPSGAGDTVRVEVPLIGLVPNPAHIVRDVVATVLSWHPDGDDIKPGMAIARIIKDNLLAVSGMSEEEARKRPNRLVMPDASRGAPADLVERYLAGTPFVELLSAPLSWGVGDADFCEHGHILARVGHGKTQQLESLIVSFLKRPDPPSLVIIDSQGDMLKRIARLKCFAPGQRLADRLVMINPREMQRPVALNPFAMRKDRLAQYAPDMREQIENGLIELIEYLFGGLLGAELTSKQGTIFRYLARLLTIIPGATIATLRDVLNKPEDFLPHMQRLEGSARDFFTEQFFASDYKSTRQQLLRRLWTVFENRTFERILSTATNKVDFFEALQTGKIVLVDTAKDFLKSERSAILGRLILAMTLQAVFERAAIPPQKRKPAYVIIDEAHEILDDNVNEFLLQARKYRGGIIIAHQMLAQLPRELRKSLAANAAVKFIGAVSDDDARALAPDLGTTPAFLLSLKKRGAHTEFALHVRNKTTSAVRIDIPFGTLDREPAMTEREWARVQERNRQTYGAPVAASSPRPPPAATTPAPVTPTPRKRPPNNQL